jgi:hypothetical protein
MKSVKNSTETMPNKKVSQSIWSITKRIREALW